MAETERTVAESELDLAIDYEHGVKNPLLKQRNYVDQKERIGYLLNDVSASFNINGFNERFIYDVVGIDFNLLAAYTFFAGLWDTFNDTFIGVLVDRTRTRWGKFKPYILLGKIPLTIFGLWFWFLPLIFADTPANYMPKFIFYVAFSVIGETAGTFTSAAGAGFMSTITPNPAERVGLITMANLVSGLVGEKLPELSFQIFYDLINNGKMDLELSKLFLIFGIGTAVISCALSFYFICVTKERVMQTIEKPNIMQGIRAIINNRPILMIVLSDFLSGFSVSKSRNNYYIDVLGSITYKTIVGIPASPVSTISYAFIKPLRDRFSTRALWIFEDFWTDMCWLGIFSLGSIGGMKKGFYKNKYVMLPAMAIEEVLEMCVYGLRHVIPAELSNEAMDYCEWKNGYRAEAMTGVARGLVTKLQSICMSSIQNIIMNYIGYVQKQEIGTQSDRTKWWLFAMGTGIPIITGALGVIPKFFYPLNGEKRERMYTELFARREAVQHAIEGGTKEQVAEIAKKQMAGDFLSGHDL